MNLFEKSPMRLFLDRLTLRSELGTEERNAILRISGDAFEARANADFVHLGETVHHACLVVDGLVGRFGQNCEGQRQITALHIAGDMVDLHSVMMPVAGSALQALATTKLIRIPHKSLLVLARKFPAIAEAFWRDSVLDAAILSQWVVNVGRRNAASRLAHLVCEMAVRYEQIGKSVGFSFELPMTQDHMADALGLTPVHVNRMLKMLRNTGVAEVRHQTVHVLDWNRLIGVGEFDAAYLQPDIGRSAAPAYA